MIETSQGFNAAALTTSERMAALASVTRYHHYTVMYYRSNLIMHGRRMGCLIQELGESVKKVVPSFDIDRAKLLALVHDDIEICVGDIAAVIKVLMTPEEKVELKKREHDSIPILVQRFFESKNAAGRWYRTLLEEAAVCKTPEAQIMKYADRLDGFGEALHEVYAGNITFAGRACPNLETPFEWYFN